MNQRKYALCRIIGNDLVPRHSSTQSINNLMFIIKNEISFPQVTKRFLLNRIIDKEKLRLLCSMLKFADMEYFEIPFRKEEFDRIENIEEQVQYITNLNQARNFCLHWCFEDKFKYVLPLDGNLFFKPDGWDEISDVISKNPNDSYFYIPMWRIKNFDDLNKKTKKQFFNEEHFDGGEKIIASTEPQLIFTKLSDCFFNESLIYGESDKTELLWRLGINGAWDYWDPSLREIALKNVSLYFGDIKSAGYVCRLPSGNEKADTDIIVRGIDRKQGIKNILKLAHN
jgi:hypothetical protein